MNKLNQRLKPEQKAYLKTLLERLCGDVIIRPANILDAVETKEFSEALVKFLKENLAEEKRNKKK